MKIATYVIACVSISAYTAHPSSPEIDLRSFSLTPPPLNTHKIDTVPKKNSHVSCPSYSGLIHTLNDLLRAPGCVYQTIRELHYSIFQVMPDTEESLESMLSAVFKSLNNIGGSSSIALKCIGILSTFLVSDPPLCILLFDELQALHQTSPPLRTDTCDIYSLRQQLTFTYLLSGLIYHLHPKVLSLQEVTELLNIDASDLRSASRKAFQYLRGTISHPQLATPTTNPSTELCTLSIKYETIIKVLKEVERPFQ